ncbi:glycosyltransferase family 4 protein [Cyanobacteria bacterium FACHB-DQ100]|uniref:glycosyltransferase family 4 protein n=1 Tax=Leptolyngbya sp. DQ-M1 TaxID=2933920 RepID=UPI00198CA596|nr:glycosyltransferase family 4 protein [Cyanobacteria bacterium FACHB-DQ100]
MKIAFIAVNNTAPWGGSEELWAQTAIYLAKSGHQVAVNVKGWATKPAQMQAIEAVCSTTYRGYDRNWMEKLSFMAQRGKSFYRWLDRVRPDLAVISQSSNNDGLSWMEACSSRSIPYVTISHIATENYWYADALNARLAIAYTQAKRAYFVSQNTRDITLKQIATPLPQARIVRNPFNVAYTATPPWQPTEAGFKLACVGRLHPPSKGQDLLFEVLRSPKWKNRPLTVTLFGSGSHTETLKRLQTLWELDQIEFASFTSDIEALWATHHGLILPSRYEGLPLVVVEAMLCGRMCIVTDVAGNTELVEDNINGFVAKAPTPELLDEALERAWQQRESWYELGKAAAEKVRQEIPPDPIAVFAEEIESLMN